MEITKQGARAACLHKLTEQKQSTLQQLLQLSEALESEGKSSVGDKHETARARIQTEIEKTGEQLKITEQQLQDFERLPEGPTASIQKGSLVTTNKGSFLIGPPLGKMNLDSFFFYAISAISPIGKLMLGKVAGTDFEINGQVYHIQKVE
jgi:transcription elongation GreA/GreB family factor